MNKVLANEKWIYQAYATDCGQLTIAELGLYLLLLTLLMTWIYDSHKLRIYIQYSNEKVGISNSDFFITLILKY